MKKKPIYIVMILVILTGCISLKTISKQESLSTEQSNNGEKNMIKKVEKTNKEWKEVLTPEQYRVMRKRGTEKSFSGQYNEHYEKGIYYCAGCDTPLFSSETKYDHGSGWPSFTAPFDENYIEYLEDNSLFRRRTEARCAVCGAHLGHVFDDGPGPAHKHYCINSVSLDFKRAESQLNQNPTTQKNQIRALKRRQRRKMQSLPQGASGELKINSGRLKALSQRRSDTLGDILKTRLINRYAPTRQVMQKPLK